MKRPDTALRNFKHGDRGSREYIAWASMKARCGNPNQHNFHRYGGRGIVVCDRWHDSYESFLNDMGRKPSPSHSLDRIDNSLGYFPENCRWATPREQALNRRQRPEFSAEHRAKLSAAGLGRKKSPETIAKSSAALKGRKLSAEHRAKLSAAWERRRLATGALTP